MNKTSLSWLGRLKNDPTHDPIAAYLTIDIQKSSEWTAELLEKIREIKTGQISSWERTGNAYCLYLYPDRIEIEQDYAEARGEIMQISLNDFEAAVLVWQKSLT